MAGSDKYRGSLADKFAQFEHYPAPSVWNGIERQLGDDAMRGKLYTSFAGLEAAPSLKVWGEIEANLQPKKRKRRRAAIWWWYGAAASLIGLGLFFLLQSQETEGIDNIASYSPRIENISGSEHLNGQGSSTNSNDNASDNSALFADDTDANPIAPQNNATDNGGQPGDESIIPNSNGMINMVAIDEVIPEGEVHTTEDKPRKNTTIDRLAVLPAGPFPMNVLPDELNGVFTAMPDIEADFTERYWQFGGSSQLLAANQKEEVFYTNPPANAFTSNPTQGGGVSIAEADQAIAAVNSKYASYSDPVYAPPVSYGLSFNKSLSKRFSIETGLTYSELPSTSEFDGYEQRTLKTKLRYLGIPIMSKLNLLLKKKWTIYTAQGVTPEVALRGRFKETVSSNGELISQSTTFEKASTTQFAVNIGAGLEYRITPQFGAYAQPHVAWYINEETSRFSYRNTKSMWPGLQLGLRFHLAD